MIAFDDIELLVKSSLEKYSQFAAEKRLSSNRDWTFFLKESLGNLGKAQKYKICASGFRDIYDPEWLYDLVWYEEIGDGDNRRLINVALVVECEWMPYFTSIKYDFEKLLIANAGHRLMICYAHEYEHERLLTYFREAINLYKHCRQGERFMIAILNSDNHEFAFDLILK